VLLIKDAEMTLEAGFGRRSAQRQQPPPRQLQHYAVLLCHNGPFTQSVDPAITDSIWLPPLVLIKHIVSIACHIRLNPHHATFTKGLGLLQTIALEFLCAHCTILELGLNMDSTLNHNKHRVAIIALRHYGASLRIEKREPRACHITQLLHAELAEPGNKAKYSENLTFCNLSRFGRAHCHSWRGVRRLFLSVRLLANYDSVHWWKNLAGIARGENFGHEAIFGLMGILHLVHN
jgi:hypothetical protein